MSDPPPRPGRGRWWLAAGVAVGLVGLAFWFVYHGDPGTGPETPRPEVPILRPEPITLLPGLHLLGGLKPSAAYAVETSDGLALIDAGLDRDAAGVKQQLAALGLDWRKVRAVFLTHAHGDHSGGAEHLRTAAGAKVYAGRGDADVLRAGGPREAFFSTFGMASAVAGPTAVDVELAGGEVIPVGDARFEAVATPGHTPGSVCYLLEHGGRRVLFSGDVIMMLRGDGRSRDRLARPLGTYAAYLAPRFRGDAAAYLASVRKLRALPAPDLLLPGHPRMDPSPQSPVMTQPRWEEMLDAGAREMELLTAEFARGGANFLDGNPKRLLPDLLYLGDHGGVAVYALTSGANVTLVNAPDGPGLVEFVQAGFKRFDLKATGPATVLLTSGGRAESGGAGELVRKYRCRVAASPATWEAVGPLCPPETEYLPPDGLAKATGLPVTLLPLRGYGTGPTAYRLDWAGRRLLFTGPIPITPTSEARTALVGAMAKGAGRPADYVQALDQLRRVTPDLWLPARPTDGQNGSLPAGDWEELLRRNLWIMQQ